MARVSKTVSEVAKLLAVEEKAIRHLREKRQAIEGDLDKLAAEIAALKGGGKGLKGGSLGVGRVRRRKPRAGGKSLREAMAEVIKKAGKPLRAAEIADKLSSVGYKTQSTDPRNMVSAMLAQSSDFRRVKKGLYVVKK